MFSLLYYMPFYLIGILTAAALVIWAVAGYVLRKKGDRKSIWPFALWQGFNILLTAGIMFVILYYSVFARTPSDEHQLVFFGFFGREFFRELITNAAVYFPFGLCLSAVLAGFTAGRGGFSGKVMGLCFWVPVVAALGMSLCVETWQYFTGAGVAQGTDVVMNTAGAALGTVHLLISKLFSPGENSKK